MKGTLYLCSTPIGNLEDISLRALRILQDVGLIAAEDTRHTRKLLSHFDLHTPMLSFHRHSPPSRIDQIVDRLMNGNDVALVTNAGTPVVSDPGSLIVQRCVEQNIPVVPIPGPSAILAALAASGFDGQRFLFAGFLPREAAERKAGLMQLRDRTETLVLFESPERVERLLRGALDVLGDRNAVLAREITKKFEEFLRGRISSLIDQLASQKPRGEFTVVIEGGDKPQTAQEEEASRLERATARVHELMKQGNGRREALRQACREFGVSRNTLYEALLGL